MPHTCSSLHDLTQRTRQRRHEHNQNTPKPSSPLQLEQLWRQSRTTGAQSYDWLTDGVGDHCDPTHNCLQATAKLFSSTDLPAWKWLKMVRTKIFAFGDAQVKRQRQVSLGWVFLTILDSAVQRCSTQVLMLLSPTPMTVSVLFSSGNLHN